MGPARPRHRAPLGRSGAYVILLLGIAAICLLHWPGRLDGDSLATIREIRSGWISDQRSPVLTWAWRQAYRLTQVGPGFVLLAQTTALTAGLYLLLRSVLKRAVAAVLAVLVLFAPPTFGFVGLVGRDAWFTACALLALGLGVAAVRWTGRPQRIAVVLAVIAAATAIAARQNGFTAVLPIAVALTPTALGLVRGPARLRALAGRRPRATAITVATLATVGALGGTVVAAKLVVDNPRHPQIWTQLYDLGYLTLQRDEQLIPSLPRTHQPVQTPAEVRDRWQNTTSIFMRFDPDLNFAPGSAPKALTDDMAVKIGDAWRTAIVESPVDYIRGRFGLWKRQLGIGHAPWYSMVLENQPNPWGYDGPAFPELGELAADYANHWGAWPGSLTGGTVHHVWIYLLVAVFGLAFALPRFPPQVRMLGALSAAAVGLQVGLFFLAPSVQLRYQTLTIYAGLIVFCAAVRMLLARMRPLGRRASARPSALQ